MLKACLSFLLSSLMILPVYAERLAGLERLGGLDYLPELLEGTRAMQVSSHDRSGDNSDGWYGTYSHLYQDEKGEYVLLDEQGAGCVYRMWTTFNQGSGNATNRFRVYFDGENEPRIDRAMGEFFAGTNAPFLFPLTGDESDSSGGYYSYVPLPYMKQCKITVSDVQRPFYYNFTCHRFDSADGVYTWDGSQDTESVGTVWRSVGSDPKQAGDLLTSVQGNVNLEPSEAENILMHPGAGTVSVLKIDPDVSSPEQLTNVWVRAVWDGASEPQVYAPLGEFFGAGFGEHEVRALPFGINRTNAYYCYFPMPFWEEGFVQLENRGSVSVSNIAYEVSIVSNIYDRARCGHFYAKAQRQHLTTEDRDYILLDEDGCGHYVGCVLSMTASHTNEALDMRYLEGDERIYIDHSRSPAIYGTGNEDYFNGGWYFKNGPFSQACHGAPYMQHDEGEFSRTNRTTAYRFHFGDMIPFRTHIRFGIEHGDFYGRWNLPGTYSSVAFFYKKEKEDGLVLSAELNVGDADSETAYRYVSQGAVLVTNEWSYEGVLDDVGVIDSGRSLVGPSSFSVPIAATNKGVLLRCRTDQGVNPQVSEVFVEGVSVGLWTLTDTNFTGVTQRWVDSEFEIPWGFTAGKTNLMIQINPMEGAWHEYLYQVLSVMPLVQSSDLDEDGIPDEWEAQYFSDIRSALPENDEDEDQLSLKEEYIAGTSPIDDQSVFEIGMEHGCISFQTLYKRNYEVWFSSNLLQGVWQSVTNLEGNGAIFSFPATFNRGFLRAEVKLDD